jgi:hypothetical protein
MALTIDRDPKAVADALADTIEFELAAQLGAPEHKLVPDDLKSIAAMVADQVLTEFDVTPRAARPALDA